MTHIRKPTFVGGRAARSCADPHCRVLVADRDPGTVAVLQQQLSEFGYTVITATQDGADVVDLCRTCQPDMAIIDHELAMSGGGRVAHVVSRRLGLPVVTTSGSGECRDVDAAVKAGAFGFVLKPIMPEQLRATVAVAVERYEAAVEAEEEVVRLKQRLEDRKVVEQAKWILVSQRGLSEPEAMRLLQRTARNDRRTIASIALSIVEAASLLDKPVAELAPRVAG